MYVYIVRDRERERERETEKDQNSNLHTQQNNGLDACRHASKNEAEL